MQNLITHVILRQTGDFTFTDILNEVNEGLTGSVYQDQAEVQRLCRRTLSLMDFSDTVYSCGDDRYYLAVSYPSYMPASVHQ